MADLDENIAVGHQAVAATPVGHPRRAACLLNLGIALQSRFHEAGLTSDLTDASFAYLQASEVASAPPSIRIQAARAAASIIAGSDTGRAAKLLQTAVRLLPETVARELDRGDQEYALSGFSGLASDAAALVLASDGDETHQPGETPHSTALGLLELGRALLLSQALDTRSDLTDLRARHPELANRYIELRDGLDLYQPWPSDAPMATAGIDEASAERWWLRDRHVLAAEFEATVTEIRSFEGFQMFMRPPGSEEMVQQAADGPLVVFNVSSYRSDALIVELSGVTSINLPRLLLGSLVERIHAFHSALYTCTDRKATTAERNQAQRAISETLEWLWDAATGPVLDKLGYLHTPEAREPWARVWWAPGGLLSLLPIHAAGHHSDQAGGNRRTVLDRVISSYTPTVRALRYARQRNSTKDADQGALIVSMPTTPGRRPLANVAKEVELLATRLRMAEVLTGDQATKQAVVDRLPDYAISHFACHGDADPIDPSQSRLLLYDHETDPFTVVSLAPVRLEHARLAYLSACRTMFSSAKLIDEAIHLAAAFQLIGYPHVVATLWEIDDALAARVSDDFYTALGSNDGLIDTTGAAHALHHSVRALRDEYPETPSLWAAYIHAGA
jgi:hypothetical protein